MNIHKTVAFLYTNGKWPEREIKKMIPFTIPSKRIIYTGINLTKEMKRPVLWKTVQHYERNWRGQK